MNADKDQRTLELITLVSREEPNVNTYITTHPLGVITSIGTFTVIRHLMHE